MHYTSPHLHRIGLTAFLFLSAIISGYSQATFTWNGATSSVWSLNTNWTKTGTSTSTWPGQNAGQTDNAVLTNVGTAPNLTITTITSSLKSVVVNTGTFTMSGSATLPVAGNITIASGATFNYSGTGSITVITGSLTTNGTLNHSSTGTISITTGSLAGTGTYNCSSTGNLSITDGSLNPTTLTNAGNNTISLTGTASDASITSGASIYNLTINKLGRSVNPAGALTCRTGSSFSLTNGTLNLAGAFASGSTFNSTSGTLNASSFDVTSVGVSGAGTAISFTTGNWTITGNNGHGGTFTSGTGTVTYNTNSNQTFQGYNTGGYNNLVLNGTGNTKTLANALRVTNNLSITGAGQTVTMATFACNINNISHANSTLNFSSGAVTINGNISKTSGTWTAPTGNWTLTGSGKTISFDAAATLTTGSVTTSLGASYALNGTTATTAGTMTTTGSFTNNSTGGLIVTGNTFSGTGSFIQGNNAVLSFTGTPTTTANILNASAIGNTVNYTNASACNILSSCLYNTLNISSGGNKTIQTGNITVNGNMSVTGAPILFANAATVLNVQGNLSSNAAITYLNGNTINVIGNFSHTGGALSLVGAASTLQFNGDYSGAGTIATAGGRVIASNSVGTQAIKGATYDTLIIDGAGTKNLAGTTTINAKLTTRGGKLNLNNATLTLAGIAFVTRFNGNGVIAGGTSFTGNTSNITLTGTVGGRAGEINFSTGGDNFFNALTISRDQSVSSASGQIALLLRGDANFVSYAFANNITQYVRVYIDNNSTFNLSPASNAATNLFATGNPKPTYRKHFLLGTNSFFKFSPRGVAMTAGGAYTFPVGPSRLSSTRFDMGKRAIGTITSSTASANVTGSATDFGRQITEGDTLITNSGTRVGYVNVITTAFALQTLGNALATTASQNYESNMLYRGITISPSVATGLSPEITIGFQNHTGGPVLSSTNVPKSNRRSYLVASIATTAGFPNSAVTMEGNHISGDSGDFSQTMDPSKIAVYRYEGGDWAKYRQTSSLANADAPGNTRYLCNNVVMTGTTNYILGQAGGDLPADPTYTWKLSGRANDNWANGGNWNRSPLTLVALFPNNATHNVEIPTGATNVIITSADSINVNDIDQRGGILNNSGILSINGNFRQNYPISLSSGTGSIARVAGTTGVVNGTLTTFNSELQKGSILYDLNNTTLGVVDSIDAATPATKLFISANSGTTYLAYNGTFFFLTTGYQTSGATLACTTNSAIVTGTGFADSLCGRHIFDGTNYIGQIVSVTNATSMVLSANAKIARTTPISFLFSRRIARSGNGTMVNNVGSRVKYVADRDQIVAGVNYHDLDFQDGRIYPANTAPPYDNFRHFDQLARKTAISGRFRVNSYCKLALTNGPKFVMANGSIFQESFGQFSAGGGNGGSNVGQPFRPHGSTGLPVDFLITPSSPSGRVNQVYRHLVNKDFSMGGPETYLLSKAQNLTFFFIDAANYTTGNSDVIDIAGNLTINGPGGGGFGLGNNNTGGVTLNLAGDYSGSNRFFNGGSPSNRLFINIAGTGPLTKSPLANLSTNNPISRLTLNRPGANLNVTNPNNIYAVAVGAGTLTLNPSTPPMDMDYLVAAGTGIINLATDVKLTPNLQNLFGYSALIQNGGTINMTGTNQTLTFDSTGAAVTGGVFNAGSSTAIFTSIYPQPVSPSITAPVSGWNLNNLTINKTAADAGTVNVIAGKVKVNGTLNMPVTNFGTLSTAGGGNVTITSSSATTAGRIGQVLGGSFAGTNYTVERTFPNQRGWYLAGSPVIGQVVSGITQLNSRFLGSLGGNPTFFRYQENDTASVYDIYGQRVSQFGWKPSVSTDVMNAGQGYRVWGGSAFMAGPRLITTNGTPFTGTKVVNLSYSGAAGYDGGGWNLVANPYASEIDFDLVTKSGSVNNAAFTWNAATGNYRVYVGGGGANLGVTVNGAADADKIASTQGFMVKTTAVGQTITFNETNKVSAANTFRRDATGTAMRITLATKAGNRSDEALLRFGGDFSPEFDMQHDAEKLDGDHLNIALALGTSTRLCVNSRPLPARNEVVGLYVSAARAGLHSITFTGTDELGSDVNAYLLDRESNTYSPIHEGMAYSFNLSNANIANPRNRFAIVLSPRAITSTKAASSMIISTYPNPATDKISVAVVGASSSKIAVEIVDMAGRKVASQMLLGLAPTHTFNTAGLQPGMYIVRVQAGNATQQQAIVIQ